MKYVNTEFNAHIILFDLFLLYITENLIYYFIYAQFLCFFHNYKLSEIQVLLLKIH